ncbi:hypothetical protein WME75_31725 [Sorangium sp. So ce1014]|uniref:hypothetical protein n=1 Tax=Sorangium sp. So ce1014 TaxID=3133326 RepID=UPI003F6360DA
MSKILRSYDFSAGKPLRTVRERDRMDGGCKSRDRLRVEVPGAEVLLARWFDAGRNVGSLAARTLQLLDAYGPSITTEAVAEMIARGTHDPGALAILCEQRRRGPVGPPAAIHFGDHVRERDVIPHDLGDYDE